MTIINKIKQAGIIPVIEITQAETVLPLADALMAGGINAIEITLRTQAALAAISLLKQQRPNILLGAGTVLHSQQLQQAIAAGAEFALSPGLDPDLLRQAKTADTTFIPGIMTPSDLLAGIKLELQNFKFFPAATAGGADGLASIAAPFQHLGIGFIPTGGISIANINQWLVRPEVIAVGGSWIATRQDIELGNWDVITAKARAAIKATGTGV